MSDIGVDGDSNRVAGRDYIEVTYAGNAREPLAPSQRKRLNQLVADVSEEYKVDPWTLWRSVVHTSVGVSTIDEISRDQFSVAERALLAHADGLKAQAHARALESEVSDLATRKGLRSEVSRFCMREFGTEMLSKLTPDELKGALHFVESHAAQPARTKPAQPAASAADMKPHRVPGFVPRIIQLVNENPLQMLAVVLAGFVIGKIF